MVQKILVLPQTGQADRSKIMCLLIIISGGIKTPNRNTKQNIGNLKTVTNVSTNYLN
jgi:hypothetical protein